MYRNPQEPTFTLTGKDALAVPTVRAYARECREHGLEDQATEVEKALRELIEWQEDHGIKYPDKKHVPHPLSRSELAKAKAQKKQQEERDRASA